MLRVGMVLYGYCRGYFGRDSYEPKRVEAIGTDWIVCRDPAGHVHFAETDSVLTSIDMFEEFASEEERRKYEDV